MKKPEPRVALVHDFLLDLRGAERVFLALCDLFPDADIFTAVYDPVGTEGRFADRRIHTSFLQKLRPDATSFRRLLPLYPYAMEALDLSGYDLVLSSSSAWAHGVLPSEDAVHVCYCHNPFRYAWNAREATLCARGPVMRAALGIVLQRWRQWDWIAAQRTEFGVDLGGANSIDGLRALWRGLLKSNAASVASLRPIIVVKERNNGLGMQLRLVAGPLSDAAATAPITCAMT